MVTLADNNPAKNLFGKTRQAILSLLYGHPEESFYLRQISRITGSGVGSVQRELKKLSDAGIIRRTFSGRHVYFQANQESPVFEGLKNLISPSGGKSAVAEVVSSCTAVPDKRMIMRRIAASRRKLAAFCRGHNIRKLALFGSILREDFDSESDVDMLVEFEPGKVPGFAFFGIQEELSKMLGRKVDLRTPEELSRYFREQVMREAKILYVGE